MIAEPNHGVSNLIAHTAMDAELNFFALPCLIRA